METATASVKLVGVFVPGVDVVLDFAKGLLERYNKINDSSAACEALCQRVKMLAERLESDISKLDDKNAIVAVLEMFKSTVNEFKVCLDKWMEYAEKHKLLKYITSEHDKFDAKIKEFDDKITKLHDTLTLAHIVEMTKWMKDDSKWKEQLKDDLNQLGDKVANEHVKTNNHMTKESNDTRDLMTEESNKIIKQVLDVFDKLNKQGEDTRNGIMKHTTDQLRQTNELMAEGFNSIRENRPPSTQDIKQLVEHLKDASSDKRLSAATKLSELAENRKHLEVIIAEDGVEPLVQLAREGFPDDIKPIVAALGAIYYFSKVKEDIDVKQTVQMMMLVLRHEVSNKGQKMMAAGVLSMLSRSKDGMKEIAEQNGISALLDTIRKCGSGLVNQQRKTYSIEVLVNLSRFADYQAEVIPELLKLLEASEAPHNVLILDTLTNLSKLSRNFRSKIVDANGFELLKHLVNTGIPNFENKAKPYEVLALELISILCEDSMSENPRTDYGYLVSRYLDVRRFERDPYYDPDTWPCNMEPQQAADVAYEESADMLRHPFIIDRYN